MKGLALVLLFYCLPAWSFPELVRHGYANCIACHVSPSGGGVMSDYGRSLSKELLSHWGREGEERVAWAVTPPEWLKLGGDYRSINTYLNTPSQKDAQYFTMQADLEAAAIIKNVDIVVSAGIKGGPEHTPKQGTFLSRRHYVTVHARDNLTLRVGRFLPKVGLMLANHTVVTERDLGWDQGQETYNAELAFLGEQNDLFVTALGGRLDDPTVDGERGLAFSASHFFWDRIKVGATLLHGERLLSSREVLGAFAIIGLTKRWYALSEVDGLWQRGTAPSQAAETHGIVSYQQLNFEWSQGFHLYAAHQLSYLNWALPGSRRDSIGVGTQLFPRPHFEFSAEIRKERTLAVADRYDDVGWVLFHGYL